MKDYTLKAYRRYLTAIKLKYHQVLLFRDFMKNQHTYASFCLIRHDVDRKPLNALNMAELESEMGIFSTYYFRAKKHTFIPEILKKIQNMGHEVGLHYESLSDSNGNVSKAMKDFTRNLEMFRKVVQVSTISMHGRPFSGYDNRDLWKNRENHEILVKELQLSEVYLDIDYSDIAYITDTGRNWSASQSNKRDKVDSKIKVQFNRGEELHSYLLNSPHPKLVFQIHPERWSSNEMDYYYNLLFDSAVNFAKKII